MTQYAINGHVNFITLQNKIKKKSSNIKRQKKI